MAFSTSAPRLLAGDCPSISSTQLPQAQHLSWHTLFTSWSRRVLSLLSAAPSFWVWPQFRPAGCGSLALESPAARLRPAQGVRGHAPKAKNSREWVER